MRAQHDLAVTRHATPLIAMSRACSARFRCDDVLLLDTGSQRRDLPRPVVAQRCLGRQRAHRPDKPARHHVAALAHVTATVTVADDQGNRQDLKFSNAYYDSASPCNLVGLPSSARQAEHQPSGVFRRTFNRASSDRDRTFTMITKPSSASN
jgi:hypothetical protein